MMPPRPAVGPYRAEHLLGLGAEGAVWRASGPAGDVALKVARTPEARALLQEEVELLGRSGHPHLVRLEAAGKGWMVTELVDGERLDRWAAGRPAADILGVGLEILAVLEHLHAAGTVHGDLKPAHVLVDDWGHVKVVDVGGGRATPGFAAPELLAGSPVTPAADRHALGATLHAALTGRAPHALPGEPALAGAALGAPVPPSAGRIDVPERVERLLGKLLLPDPAQRPPLDEVRKVLVRAWASPPRRPFLGMQRARSALLRAVRRAVHGEPVVVVLYGPTGSGRRSLTAEALRQGALEGMELLRRFDAATFLEAVAAGRRPVGSTRTTAPDVQATTEALLRSGRPGLLLLHGAAPPPWLPSDRAVVLTPEALTLDDAEQLADWLGVTRREAVPVAWRRSQGLPRSLWIALEPYATRHTEDRRPFGLPGSAAHVVRALREGTGVATLQRLGEETRLPLPVLADQVAILEATGIVRTEERGWTVRLLDAGGP
ncbi:MAG: serine/threonine protein kinase [Alphaproteobacteria bacterium]|nr:serine/threonine protein kinase [Alphaproteobacteria bacterium]